MKNIQIIDGAKNCVYDIFSATKEEFDLLFPEGTDIAFIDEIYVRENEEKLDAAFRNIWKRPIKKIKYEAYTGLFFYELEEKKMYYPTRKDEEAVNPDGSKLR